MFSEQQQGNADQRYACSPVSIFIDHLLELLAASLVETELGAIMWSSLGGESGPIRREIPFLC